jgi:sterigmatocystin biosynthesis cytochrome P450 monooxygenase
MNVNMKLTIPSLLQTTLAVAIGLQAFYRVLSFVRQLQKHGLVCPQNSCLFHDANSKCTRSPCLRTTGILEHIPLSVSIIRSMPPFAHGVHIGYQIRQRYPHLESAFYLDAWPFATPILVVLKPDMMYQLTQANQIPKDKGLRPFLEPLMGKEDLLTLEGAAWKRWRAIFYPGVSASHISSLPPRMVEVFKNILDEHAKNGDILYLEDSHGRTWDKVLRNCELR